MAHDNIDRALVRRWIDSGEPRMRTIVRVADMYGLSHHESHRLVHDVLADVVSTVGDIDRQEFLAQQITRLETLAVRAQEEGSLSVALSAYRELHALVGLREARG